jgi:hypothetical protein
VKSPDGRAWEIYAYKIQLRDRSGRPRSRTVRSRARAIPRAILRSRELAVAGVRSLRSDQWTIEAIAFLPRRERYAWTTTSEFKGQVLAQVEGNLARGDIPHRLTNATYLGARR